MPTSGEPEHQGKDNTKNGPFIMVQISTNDRKLGQKALIAGTGTAAPTIQSSRTVSNSSSNHSCYGTTHPNANEVNSSLIGHEIARPDGPRTGKPPDHSAVLHKKLFEFYELRAKQRSNENLQPAASIASVPEFPLRSPNTTIFRPQPKSQPQPRATPPVFLGRQEPPPRLQAAQAQTYTKITACQHDHELQQRVTTLELQLKEQNAKIKCLTSQQQPIEKLCTEIKLIGDQYCEMKTDFKKLIGKLEEMNVKISKKQNQQPQHPVLSSSSSSNTSITCCSSPEKLPPSFCPMHFDELIQNLKDLNCLILAKSTSSLELCYTNSGATFKPLVPTSVTIWLYKNGFNLEGQIYPFSSDQTLAWIQDVLDGYLPSQLQSKYPNGVIFKIEDNRTEVFKGSGMNIGGGHKLGGGSYVLNGDQQGESTIPKIYPKSTSTTGSLTPTDKANNSNGSTSHHRLSASPFTGGSSNSSSLASIASSSASISIEKLPDLAPSINKLQKYSLKKKLIALKLKDLSTGKQYRLNTTPDVSIISICQHLGKFIIEQHDSSDDDGSEEEAEQVQGASKVELINSAPFGLFGDTTRHLKDYQITNNCLIYFRKKKQGILMKS